MTAIAELALNFDLSPENGRFLDPPARLFSILDFKNSDDTNRWGDTSQVRTPTSLTVRRLLTYHLSTAHRHSKVCSVDNSV